GPRLPSDGRSGKRGEAASGVARRTDARSSQLARHLRKPFRPRGCFDPENQRQVKDAMTGMPRNRRPLESSLQIYLRQINETSLLSAVEEVLLAQRIQAGDAEARDHLVRANLRLVVNLARSYQGKGLDLADLIAEGNLGLFRAAEAFDPAMQTRFSTY